ncbi:peptidase [Weissella confusa]|nr:peptidase [Weissella confusa]
MMWLWGRYLVPVLLFLVGGMFLLMLFVGLMAGSEDEGCYATDTTQTSASGTIGGDWKDKNSGTHKAMQYAADQFKNNLHMSGDNIAAALAIGLRESGFNPAAVNPSGAVKGIWQWGSGGINGNRYGTTPDTVEGQVSLAITELRTTHMATLTHMSNADLSASLEAWDVYFEGLTVGDPQRKVAQITATATEVKKVFDLNFAGSVSTGAGGDAGNALNGSNSDTSSCASTTGTASGLPVKGRYNITGGYPDYAGATGAEHYGTDFQTVGAQETGEASNVYSVSDGTVVAKTSDSIGGNYVVIKNVDSTYAYYGHAPTQASIVVNMGDKVKRGQHISHQGQTGLATGVHVHFAVNQKQNSFAPRSDGLISPGDYLTALPKQAIPGKGLVAPAGPFTASESGSDKKTDKK